MGDNNHLCDIAFKVLSKYPEDSSKRKDVLGRFFSIANGNGNSALDLLARFPEQHNQPKRAEILKEWLNAVRNKKGKFYSEHGDYVYSDEPLSGSDRWLMGDGHIYFAGRVYFWEEDDGPGMIHPEYKGYLVELIRNPQGYEFLFLTDKGRLDRIWRDNVYQNGGRDSL